MNAFEYILPPNVNGTRRIQGYLEIEVSRINFIIDGKYNTKEEVEKSAKRKKKKIRASSTIATKHTYTHPPPTKCNKDIAINNYQLNNNSTLIENQTVIAKFKWFGENHETAASICISSSSVKRTNHHKQKKQRQSCYKQGGGKEDVDKLATASSSSSSAILASASSSLVLQCHNKIRYNICISLALFLEYLHSCEPIEIVVVGGGGGIASEGSGGGRVLGQTYLRLPSVLLRKYAANYTTGCTFEHKTKIYTLYKNKSNNNNGQSIIDQQQPQEKTGEIQLRFRMLFAPSAAANHAPAVLQKQLDEPKVEKSSRILSKSEEIVEAMMKLDAKLVAYLAGAEEEEEDITSLERLENGSPINHLIDEMAEQSYHAQKLEVFKRISAIKLQMEALTLQPEGTKRMELLQSEIRPIFTVECQLSPELIKNMPRYDMFHIMQFESEKFQSLTQCTRFGQESKRNVSLSLDDDNNVEEKAANFGRIHFAVWWREPGTCFNEMLGMGVLELEELYNASLLEQCKCITINRRGIHLASLYLKISLQLQRCTTSEDVQQLQQLLDQTSIKQWNTAVDNNENTTTSTTEGANGKGGETNGNPQQQQQKNDNEICSTQCGGGGGDNPATTATTDNENNSANNGNPQLESTNFMAETSKVRLLKGFIHASETRNLEMSTNGNYILVCRRFWQEEAAIVTAIAELTEFNYEEQFAIIHDEKFVNRCEKQHLQLEVWQRINTDVGDDGYTKPGEGNHNANVKGNLQSVGIVQLPLHQFFIAYRDESITNHLCKGKFPVVSIDAWVPIVNFENNSTNVGELKCLLAIGSEEQITNLKLARGFKTTTLGVPATGVSKFDVAFFSKNHLDAAVAVAGNINNWSSPAKAIEGKSKLKNTSDLFDMLEQALISPVPSYPTAKTAPPALSPAILPTTSSSTSAKRLQSQLFTFMLEIQRASGLPLNPAAKGKKAAKRNAAAIFKRFPPNEAPSTYVTFQADECVGKAYKSHEGPVYATNIVEKCTQPEWQQRFRVAANIEYLTEPQRFFIFKIWKKATIDSAKNRLEPTPIDDGIIGFIAVDLNIFLSGLQVYGSFNIVDYNGRVNGQLELRCQLLESIDRLLYPPIAESKLPITPGATITSSASDISMDTVIGQFENSLDLTHLNLGQAIKRKFTELEEISQRLRTRLVDVTGEPFAPNFDVSTLDSWQPFDDGITADDADLNEFEHDINILALPTISNSSAPPLNTDKDVGEDAAPATEMISNVESVTANNSK